jgi:hypothetical protein
MWWDAVLSDTRAVDVEAGADQAARQAPAPCCASDASAAAGWSRSDATRMRALRRRARWRQVGQRLLDEGCEMRTVSTRRTGVGRISISRAR